MIKFHITKQYAQEFDHKCEKSEAHEFLRFITKTDSNNISLLDLIAQVGDLLKFKPTKPDREIDLNEQKISNCMNEFFSLYMPQKAEQVKQILNKTHPYFVDKDGGTHVNFISVKQGDPHLSNVRHSGRNSFLEFSVYTHNSLEDLRTTAHELSHAISSHNCQLIDLLRSNVPQQEIDKYTQKNLEKDCIGEIESLITEKLFNRFLVKKGLYSKEDLLNYESKQEVSLINEINLIREEKDVVSNLTRPVTFKSLDKLVNDLQKHHQTRLLDRVQKMHDDNKCSYYMFRYVVGRIVADQWMEKFDKTQDKQSQFDMLNKFQNYLDKTHELDLNGACESLIGKNFACVVEDYVADKVNENKMTDEMIL